MKVVDEIAAEVEFAARVGLDWANRAHVWAMQPADGKREDGELNNTPEAIEVWAAELSRRFKGKPIAVALEQSRGALIAMLTKYSHLVLFPVHPNTVSNYRNAFSPSGAKSDPGDAGIILELLTRHPDKLRRLKTDTEATRRLQFFTEERRRLVEQRSSETQILTGWLNQVYPQVLALFGDPSSPMVRDLLTLYPTLKDLKKARPDTLRKFFWQHNCRGEERITERLDAIKNAVQATTDEPLLAVAAVRIRTSVQVLAQLQDGIDQMDSDIEKTYKTHPDRAIMQSFPGAGPALEPRLIAAVGSIRERFESAADLASFAGIAPVTESSGQALYIHWRWACPKFIRQTFHEWAGCSVRLKGWARDHYKNQRNKGNGHHAAVRSVAFKWIRIFYRCWRDNVPYDEQIYLKALAKQKAPKKHDPKTTSAPLQVVWKTCAGGLSTPVKISIKSS